jgi:predicted nucleic acid-binding protein
VLGRKKRLSLDTLLLAVAALPVSVVERDAYAHAVPQALKLIGRRGPDDTEILSLALHLQIPLWSNGNDFEGTSIARYTTAEFLHKLGTSCDR